MAEACITSITSNQLQFLKAPKLLHNHMAPNLRYILHSEEVGMGKEYLSNQRLA